LPLTHSPSFPPTTHQSTNPSIHSTTAPALHYSGAFCRYHQPDDKGGPRHNIKRINEPLSPALSPLVPRGERESLRARFGGTDEMRTRQPSAPMKPCGYRRNPVGVVNVRTMFSQGSSFLATPGLEPESLWDSPPLGSRSKDACKVQAPRAHFDPNLKSKKVLRCFQWN